LGKFESTFSDYFSGTKGLSVVKFVSEQMDHIKKNSFLSYRIFAMILFKYEVLEGYLKIFNEIAFRV